LRSFHAAMYRVTIFVIALPSMEMILAGPGFPARVNARHAWAACLTLAGKGRVVTYIRGNCPSDVMV
jgi:hypothetical protein